jgi:hypothetical protein
MNKYCPRYYHKEVRKEVSTVDTETNKTTLLTFMEYTNMECNENCAL